MGAQLSSRCSASRRPNLAVNRAKTSATPVEISLVAPCFQQKFPWLLPCLGTRDAIAYILEFRGSKTAHLSYSHGLPGLRGGSDKLFGSSLSASFDSRARLGDASASLAFASPCDVARSPRLQRRASQQGPPIDGCAAIARCLLAVCCSHLRNILFFARYFQAQLNSRCFSWEHS